MLKIDFPVKESYGNTISEGLDLENFEVLEIRKLKDTSLALIMKTKYESAMPFCIEYRGAGH